MTHDADWAFDRYEAVRHRFPKPGPAGACVRAETLLDIADAVDVFVLDGFGVLNVGETAIPGVAARLADLRARGKALIVLTNAARYSEKESLSKYLRFGFDFRLEEIVSSRTVMTAAMAGMQSPGVWGLAAPADSALSVPGHGFSALGDDIAAYDAAAGFVLLSAAGWTETPQDLLVASLKRRPRPVLVGNPDIVAPREDRLSLEPGFYAHDLADRTGVEPAFFGKPFENAFDAVLARLAELGVSVERSRMAMVGDTLHTDILGGSAAGMKTVLVTDHGLFAGRPVEPYIERSGLRPDFILPTA